MHPEGRREAKKSQTRQLIADVAGELFDAHGFDRVTVEEIAAAADVSKKTVFNYFPTKEDLVFDRADDRRSALLAAVNDRPDGTTVLESFRNLCLAQSSSLAQLRADTQRRSAGFFELVAANPSLQRKAHEVTAELTRILAGALAAHAGVAADDVVAAITASTLVAAQRTLHQRLRELAGSTLSDATVIRRHRRETNRVFDQLCDGFGNYAATSSATPPNRASAADVTARAVAQPARRELPSGWGSGLPSPRR